MIFLERNVPICQLSAAFLYFVYCFKESFVKKKTHFIFDQYKMENYNNYNCNKTLYNLPQYLLSVCKTSAYDKLITKFGYMKKKIAESMNNKGPKESIDQEHMFFRFALTISKDCP